MADGGLDEDHVRPDTGGRIAGGKRFPCDLVE
jgi:hypothetical protein